MEIIIYMAINILKALGANHDFPPDLQTITLRQDAVQELTENEELFYQLQAVTSRFLDVDNLLSLCVQVRWK